ncbi:PTS sugar transporter subunit IIB [Erysipelothrix sp. HDW6C]|uniref:PTS system mannose/fructose/N-acetylgalactosamine-transporter subunit IIB n=1 Tax=Erysipelothrix sp. HDW6C TaxID=2714930 RepID=UPI001409C592|nr:PTS sugar transporter subunit IIB [Erysipelothrix sp. HDW6C]QIK68839.1 PTS sugar transporter subunit IIB [Erysipelothrix sp. HDW6C]
MIKLLRIDERLIHGQVVLGWSKHYNITHIVVANDEAANSPLLQKTLKMAAPAGIKVAIKSIDEANKLLTDPKGVNASIMVLVNNPEDAYKILTANTDVKSFNIGNYGRLNAAGESRVQISAGLLVNDYDRQWFEKILDTGVSGFVQMTLDQKSEDLGDLLRR